MRRTSRTKTPRGDSASEAGGRGEAAILHELAAIVSSVVGFAELVERLPDHPRREEFIALVAAESRRAVGALRDLQLLRALAAGLVPAPEDRAGIAALLAAIERHTDAEIASSPGADSHARDLVAVPERLVSELGARCIDAASARLGRRARVEVRPADDALELVVESGSAADYDRVAEAVDSFRAEFRVAGVLRELLRASGGDLVVARSGGESSLVLRLPVVQPSV